MSQKSITSSFLFFALLITYSTQDSNNQPLNEDSITEEIPSTSPWGILVKELVVVDSETGGQGLEIDGDTTVDNQKGQEELSVRNGSESQIPRKFLELYFSYKTARPKKSQVESRPLGIDIFNESSAQVSPFPEPHPIQIVEENEHRNGEFKEELIQTTPQSPTKKSSSDQQQQFDVQENSSDLMLIDLSSDKHLASSTQEPSTETRLMFPNDLVAKSTLNGLSFGEGGNGIKDSLEPKITIIPTRKPPSLRKLSPPQCSDTAVDCPEKEHLCESQKYGEIMWRMCPYTCNACFKHTSADTCVDASPLCAKKASYCQISYYTAIMNRVCPKTCKSC